MKLSKRHRILGRRGRNLSSESDGEYELAEPLHRHPENQTGCPFCGLARARRDPPCRFFTELEAAIILKHFKERERSFEQEDGLYRRRRYDRDKQSHSSQRYDRDGYQRFEDHYARQQRNRTEDNRRFEEREHSQHMMKRDNSSLAFKSRKNEKEPVKGLSRSSSLTDPRMFGPGSKPKKVASKGALPTVLETNIFAKVAEIREKNSSNRSMGVLDNNEGKVRLHIFQIGDFLRELSSFLNIDHTKDKLRTPSDSGDFDLDFNILDNFRLMKGIYEWMNEFEQANTGAKETKLSKENNKRSSNTPPFERKRSPPKEFLKSSPSFEQMNSPPFDIITSPIVENVNLPLFGAKTSQNFERQNPPKEKFPNPLPLSKKQDQLLDKYASPPTENLPIFPLLMRKNPSLEEPLRAPFEYVNYSSRGSNFGSGSIGLLAADIPSIPLIKDSLKGSNDFLEVIQGIEKSGISENDLGSDRVCLKMLNDRLFGLLTDLQAPGSKEKELRTTQLAEKCNLQIKELQDRIKKAAPPNEKASLDLFPGKAQLDKEGNNFELAVWRFEEREKEMSISKKDSVGQLNERSKVPPNAERPKICLTETKAEEKKDNSKENSCKICGDPIPEKSKSSQLQIDHGSQNYKKDQQDAETESDKFKELSPVPGPFSENPASPNEPIKQQTPILERNEVSKKESESVGSSIIKTESSTPSGADLIFSSGGIQRSSSKHRISLEDPHLMKKIEEIAENGLTRSRNSSVKTPALRTTQSSALLPVREFPPREQTSKNFDEVCQSKIEYFAPPNIESLKSKNQNISSSSFANPSFSSALKRQISQPPNLSASQSAKALAFPTNSLREEFTLEEIH